MKVLRKKTREAGGFCFGDVELGDFVEIVTLNSVYVLDVLDGGCNPCKKVLLSSTNERFKKPVEAVVEGSFDNDCCFHSGWIFIGASPRFTQKECRDNTLVLSSVREVRVNDVKVLP